MSQFICIGKKNKRKDLSSTILNKSGAGFTIVELLAVIAIIGFLAAIVLVRTGTAKKKGQDAAIQIALREVRNAAELHYNDDETYEGVCDTSDDTLAESGDFKRIEDYIDQRNGPNGVIGCQESENAYAVISSLSTKNCWCVDSQGASREVELVAGNCREKLTTITCPD